MFTVSELTRKIKLNLEGEFSNVMVQGEISNLAKPASGHLYFQLKDDQSQISCVLFRFSSQHLKFELENGLEVILKGKITVYEPRGNYQLLTSVVQPVGTGALQLAFDQLKKKLIQEGLFDPKHKKKLPFLPQQIGIITSPTGAVIQDILHVLNRRFPSIPVLINPVLVQGELASKQIAKAISQLDENPFVDVIILARGGGSIEDLWAFNEELVAREVFICKTPIISAIGHETDYTICDFVADVRASTPSVAAELIVPDREELALHLDALENTCIQKVKHYIQILQEKIKFLRYKISTPEQVIQQYQKQSEALQVQLMYKIEQIFLEKKHMFSEIYNTLQYLSPKNKFQLYQEQYNQCKKRLTESIVTIIQAKSNQLENQQQLLEVINPNAILNRGYTFVADSKGKMLYKIQQIQKQDLIDIQFVDGIVKATVDEIRPLE